jgi:hypothetical protein
MPSNPHRAGLYDQFEEDRPFADWGGDELFKRMPRPRAVDDAPAPRFRPSLVLVDPPEERRREPHGGIEPSRRTPDEAMRERAERLGIALVDAAEADAPAARHWDDEGNLVEPPAERRTKVITGHPGGAPRPLPTVREPRRRPTRTPAEWIGPQPERIVGWAFALGLVLILIAILT